MQSERAFAMCQSGWSGRYVGCIARGEQKAGIHPILPATSHKQLRRKGVHDAELEECTRGMQSCGQRAVVIVKCLPRPPCIGISELSTFGSKDDCLRSPVHRAKLSKASNGNYFEEDEQAYCIPLLMSFANPANTFTHSQKRWVHGTRTIYDTPKQLSPPKTASDTWRNSLRTSQLAIEDICIHQNMGSRARQSSGAVTFFKVPSHAETADCSDRRCRFPNCFAASVCSKD